MGNIEIIMAKLTEKQWDKIRSRILDGEKTSVLATEYKISRQAIEKKLGCEIKQVKTVAIQLVESDQNLKKLPEKLQVATSNYADKLRKALFHSSSAAEFGAMTAHKLSGLAFDQAKKIDTDKHGNLDLDILKTVAMLTEVSNKANDPAIKLLATLKDQIQDEERANKIQNLMLQAIEKASPEIGREIAKNISKLNAEIQNNHYAMLDD